MAFSDPQSIKPDNTTAVSLPRVDTGNYSSVYKSADGLTTVRISTANGRRRRHLLRLDLEKVVASTITPSQNEVASCSVMLIVDRPLTGFTAEELRKAVEGFSAFLSGTEFSAVKKLLGSES